MIELGKWLLSQVIICQWMESVTALDLCKNFWQCLLKKAWQSCVNWSEADNVIASQSWVRACCCKTASKIFFLSLMNCFHSCLEIVTRSNTSFNECQCFMQLIDHLLPDFIFFWVDIAKWIHDSTVSSPQSITEQNLCSGRTFFSLNFLTRGEAAASSTGFCNQLSSLDVFFLLPQSSAFSSFFLLLSFLFSHSPFHFLFPVLADFISQHFPCVDVRKSRCKQQNDPEANTESHMNATDAWAGREMNGNKSEIGKGPKLCCSTTFNLMFTGPSSVVDMMRDVKGGSRWSNLCLSFLHAQRHGMRNVECRLQTAPRNTVAHNCAQQHSVHALHAQHSTWIRLRSLINTWSAAPSDGDCHHWG